jgi:hypothetical protein
MIRVYKLNRFWLLLIAMLLVSCIREVDMEVEDIPHLLVVNCFFTEGEAFRVNVSRLAAYTDLTDRNITNAHVTISTNGNYTGTLTYVANGIYSNPTVLPEPGKVYQVTVDVEGYPQTTAQDSLPKPVPIDSVTYSVNAGKYDDGINYNQYAVWFRDIPGKTWYSIQIPGFDIFSTDPVISAEGVTGEEFNSWFVFNDTLISNRMYSLKINVGDYYYDIKESRILLVSGTFPYYQYLKRLIKHGSYSWQDPFKPYNPVPLYTNIKNGLGVFAGFQARSYDLMISETNNRMTSPPTVAILKVSFRSEKVILNLFQDLIFKWLEMPKQVRHDFERTFDTAPTKYLSYQANNRWQ